MDNVISEIRFALHDETQFMLSFNPNHDGKVMRKYARRISALENALAILEKCKVTETVLAEPWF
jgi:hypothetical protein